MSRLAFAFGAGLLAPVNPCGFAMLPAFLGYYLGDASRDRGASGSVLARLAQGFAVGGAVSVGFAGAFVVAALLVSVGLRSLVGYVPWAAAAIGAVLVGLGLAMTAGRQVALRPIERLRPGHERGYRRMALFGAAYALASLSCTLAVLLAVVAQALATTNPAGLAGVLVAYGAGAATVLTALSLSAALTRGALARSMRRALPYAGRLGGLLLVASGLYLLAYWLPVLAGSPSSPLSGFASVVSGRLTDLLDASREALGALALVLLVGGGALAVRSRRSRRPVQAQTACCEEGAGDPRAQVLTGRDRQP